MFFMLNERIVSFYLKHLDDCIVINTQYLTIPLNKIICFSFF